MRADAGLSFSGLLVPATTERHNQRVVRTPLNLNRRRQRAAGLPCKSISRHVAVTVAFGLSVWLMGCTALRTGQPAPQTPAGAAEADIPPAAEPATAAMVPAPDPQPRPPVSDPAPGQMPGAATEQAAALPPPLPPGYLSSRLVGLDFVAMRAQLGEPDAILEAAPAQEWVYRKDVCLLTVRFFPEGAALQYKALSVSVRSESSEDGEDVQCPQRFAERLQPRQ